MIQNATYGYRAARRDGAVEVGALEAQNREDAAAQLSRRGLFPIEIRLEAEDEERQERIPAGDLALGLRILATLLESGLPVSRALAALDELVPAALHRALPAVREAVREGKSLASALQAAPLEVPPVVIGMVRAGEAGSGIAAAVRRAADFMEAVAATRRAIRGALAYPLILAGAGAASIALLVGIVLPRFESILADLGQALPPATRLVLAVAAAARASALPMMLTLGLTAIAWKAWVGTSSGRTRWHQLLLGLPLAGPVRRAAATSRICAALAALLDSGVPLATALPHAARAGGDAALAARLLAAREAILEGSGVARAFEAEQALTPTAVRLVRAGEETGKLAEMLAHVSKLESERAEQAVRTGVRLLEPALIVGFGGVVAVVAAALLQAVYSVRPSP